MTNSTDAIYPFETYADDIENFEKIMDDLDKRYMIKSEGTGHYMNYENDRVPLLEKFISHAALQFPYCNVWIGNPITGYPDEYDKKLNQHGVVGLYITNNHNKDNSALLSIYENLKHNKQY